MCLSKTRTCSPSRSSNTDDRAFDLIAVDLGVDLGPLGLTPVQLPELIRKQRIHVFSISPSKMAETLIFEQLAAGSPLIRSVGAVVSLRNDSVSFVTNEVVVQLKANAVLPPVVDGHTLTVVRQLTWLENGWLLRGSGGSLQTNRACNQLAEHPDVIFAEPNTYSTAVPHSTGPDEFMNFQPHHTIIDSAGAWAVSKGDNIRIAIIDGGCRTNHEDLAPNFERAMNFETLTSVVAVDEHGTKCAGIAVAVLDNSLGVAGVAGNARLWAIQRQSGSDVDHSEMFLWCAGIDPHSARPSFPAVPSPAADVISCSWGVPSMAPAASIESAFNQLHQTGRSGRGCVVVFSVGNQTPSGDFFPTIYPWASYGDNIAVAASTIPVPYALANERKVSTSNYGPGIDVCAPGGERNPSASTDRTLTTHWTTSPTLYQTFSGRDYALHGETSCACPQVAGVAALMLAAHPGLTSKDIKRILRDTSVKIDAANTDPTGQYVNGVSQRYGFGRINAAAAVIAARDQETLLEKLLRVWRTLYRYYKFGWFKKARTFEPAP